MKVVNIYKDKYTHFCGRAGSYKEIGVDYSILGNPFEMSKYGRDGCIEEFRKYLNEHRKKESEVWQAVVALPEYARLACFCAPKRCHCDVIVSAWKWHKAQAEAEMTAVFGVPTTMVD